MLENRLQRMSPVDRLFNRAIFRRMFASYYRLIIIIIMGSFLTSLFRPSISGSKLQLLPVSQAFDPLTATAADLQELLSTGRLTSVDLVRRSFAQMDKYDGYLRAIISRAPKALKLAQKLDKERKRGHIRGPLHGIPILVKDNIATDPRWGMETTAGSFALQGSRPSGSASVVLKLANAGAIILAKSRLSEFANYKGSDLPPGWSAIGGQTQSAYTSDDVDKDDLGFGHSNPGGSSTGSAVGVSAGYTSIAIGTDTTGSVIIPSTRASLYGLRLTTGISNMTGIVPFSTRFDTIGVMAKCPLDVADLLDVIVDRSQPSIPLGGYRTALSETWRGLRIGVLSPEKWYIPPSLGRPNAAARKQLDHETLAAYEKLRGLGASIQNVDLISWEEMAPDHGESLFDLFAADFRADIESYLANLSGSKVRTLAAIVEFNKKHAELELPPGHDSQDMLINALENNMSTEKYQKLLSRMRELSQDLGIDKTLKDNALDVIVGPADSAFSLLACGAGYPSATFPLSYLDFNGRPFGLFALASKNKDATLLQVMSAWEKSFPRHPPNLDVLR